MTQPIVFLIGAPRSGSTWLQHMLGAHPAVASPQETDLFNRYVAAWQRNWDEQLAASTSGRRRRGLPAVLTRHEFDAILADVVATVYRHALALKPTATLVLDKNPSHVFHVAEIVRIFPQARFLHLVRDGRDVAVSVTAAGRSWGWAWAPRDVAGAARRWREGVRAARGAAGLAGGYLELRYEDLSADPAGSLARAFAFCGVAVGEETCSTLTRRFAFERLATGEDAGGIVWGGELAARGLALEEPAGFYRAGRVGGWQSAWGAFERWQFDRVAGDLLCELGYEADHHWVGTRRPRVLLEAQAVARRLRRRLTTQ